MFKWPLYEKDKGAKWAGFCHKVIYKAVKVVAIFGAFKRTNRRTDAFKEVLADLKKNTM